MEAEETKPKKPVKLMGSLTLVVEYDEGSADLAQVLEEMQSLVDQARGYGRVAKASVALEQNEFEIK